VELDLSGSAFGKQLKRADRSGARWAVVIGEDEAQVGQVIVKNLQEQTEQPMAAAELLSQFA